MSDKSIEQLSEPEEGDLKQLLQKNLACSQEILTDMKRIKKMLFWRFVMNVVWLIIIIVPVIASLFFLPSFINNYLGGYGELLGQQNGLPQILEQLKK